LKAASHVLPSASAPSAPSTASKGARNLVANPQPSSQPMAAATKVVAKRAFRRSASMEAPGSPPTAMNPNTPISAHASAVQKKRRNSLTILEGDSEAGSPSPALHGRKIEDLEPTDNMGRSLSDGIEASRRISLNQIAPLAPLGTKDPKGVSAAGMFSSDLGRRVSQQIKSSVADSLQKGEFMKNAVAGAGADRGGRRRSTQMGQAAVLQKGLNNNLKNETKANLKRIKQMRQASQALRRASIDMKNSGPPPTRRASQVNINDGRRQSLVNLGAKNDAGRRKSLVNLGSKLETASGNPADEPNRTEQRRRSSNGSARLVKQPTTIGEIDEEADE